VVTNPGELPLYDVTLLIWKPNDFPANGRTMSIGTLQPYELFRRLNLEIPLDSYIVDIRTRATPFGFFESLKITEINGQIHQSYYVRRIGSDQKLMDAP
jgi:hypothetical protein